MKTADIETYTLDGVADADRQDRFEHQLSLSHTNMRVRLAREYPARNFSSDIRRAWIGDLALVDATCGPCSGGRPAKMTRQSDTDYVVILINRGGSEIVTQDDSVAELHPGEAVLWDTTRPVTFRVISSVTKRSLFVPRAALEEIGARSLGIAGAVLHRDTPTTELLTSYLDVLSRTADSLSTTALLSARNATLNLVSAAMQPESAGTDPHQINQVLHANMVQDIERNLTRFDLGPALIARNHHVSVRSVHRLFEGSGDTITGFIRSRRLARARQDLASGIDTVSTIAQRWCFSDASHFARLFKKQFGMSPSDYRESQTE